MSPQILWNIVKCQNMNQTWHDFVKKKSNPFESDTVSPHILYDFYIGNEAAREEAELKEAARWELSQQWQCNELMMGFIIIIIMVL